MTWITRLSWAAPVAVLASFYLTWGTAWIALGHRPRPMLDDPKYIGLSVDVPYAVTMCLLTVAPAAMVTGLLFAAPGAPFPKRAIRTLILAALWAMTIAWLRWDPLRVGEWFMD